jgi:hypothetical protein
MALSPYQMSFAGGELSPLLVHRFDQDVYAIGARTLSNFIVLSTGALVRRPGTHHADDGSTKGNVPAYLIGWQYSVDDTYVLEFTPLKMRVYRDHAIILSGASPLEVDTPFTVAELPYLHVYQSGDVLWIQTGARDTYRLTRTSHTAWTLSPVNIEDGPWLSTNTTSTTLTASATGNPGDSITLTASVSLFVAGHVGAMFRLDHLLPARSQNETFTSETEDAHELLVADGAEWEFIVSGSGPASFQIDLQASFDATTWFQYRTVAMGYDGGNWRERASGANEEGQAIYLRAACVDYAFGTINTTINALPYTHNGIVKATAYTSATVLTCEIIVSPGNTNATADWAENAFNDVQGWPRALGFLTERLLMAGTTGSPLRIDAGVSGDYESFDPGQSDDTDAFWVTLSDAEQNIINWIKGDWRDTIIVGTRGGIVELMPLSGSGGFTPTNYPAVRRKLAVRTSRILPLMADDILLVAGGLGTRKLYGVYHSTERGGLLAEDMTRWAPHVSGTGFTGLIMQRDPESLLWLPRADGETAALTLRETSGAWHRHTFGEGVVSGCTIPTDDGDELWLCVERLVAGVTTYFIEYMHKIDVDAAVEDAYHLDCGESWNGGDAVAVESIVRANPAEIRLTDWPQDGDGTDLADGNYVRFRGVCSDLLDQVFQVYNADAVAMALNLKDETGAVVVDGTLFDSYVSGGTMEWVAKTLGGMGHLAGESLLALTDGVEQDVTPDALGAVTLDGYYNTSHVGIGLTSRFVSLPPEFYLRTGTTVGDPKELSQLTVSLYKSRGGQYGVAGGDLKDIPYSRVAADTSEPPILFTGEKHLPAIGGVFKGEMNVVVEASGAYPFTIRGIVPKIEAYS